MEKILAVILISTFLLVDLKALPLNSVESNDSDNAEQLGGHFEGDIVMNEKLKNMLMTRTGLMDLSFRWKDGIIPYVINETHFNQEQLNYIREAMDGIEKVTCIKIVKRTDEEDFVYVRGDNGGCYSEVGRIGGVQDINLQPNVLEVGCFRKYSIIHEFLHALGFFHMQSATDRDEYVKIVWDKIQKETLENFEWYGYHEITHFGIPYDYGSVMHYPRVSFSIDGSETIIPTKNKTAEIGQRVRLSDSDILRINRMYNCGREPEPTETPKPDKPPKPSEIIKKAVADFINSFLKGLFSNENKQ